MSRWPATLLLITSTVISAYLILIAADYVPRFFAVAFKVPASDLGLVMPVPTLVVCRDASLFALASAVIALATIVIVNRRERSFTAPVIVGLCSQGLVLWLAAFGLCFDAFQGPMSLHHGPSFELENFLMFASGVFPVALVSLLVPLAWICLTSKRRELPSPKK